MLGYTRIRSDAFPPRSGRLQLAETKPRKLPRQHRSQATFDAIVEACARLLRARDGGPLTTNHIAQRAGVSIGTLYEFFPNREAILAVLAQQRLAGLLGEVEAALARSRGLPARAAVEHLIRRIVEAVCADRELYRLVFRDARFLQTETQRAREAFFELARASGERAHARVDLPRLEADTWLIGRMLANAVLEIAFAGSGTPERSVLVEELARLTHRMLGGSDATSSARR